MTWDAKAEYRPEVQKCRYRLIRFCNGGGLDIGCGPEKIKPGAIGVDRQGGDVNRDLSQGLAIFRDRCMDFVFSSHCLEDFYDTKGILADWWRVIRVGGNLVLYLPHKDHYPNIGQPGANPDHKHDFLPEDIIRAMDDIGASYEVLFQGIHSDKDEYSFSLVFKKLASEGMPFIKPTPKPKDDRPKALVIRYGAFGDHIIASSCLPHLKAAGYRVTYNTVPRGLKVLEYNPHIDEFWVQEPDVIPAEELGAYWEEISQGFDRVVNLNQSIEGKFLALPGSDMYNAPEDERRFWAKGNYYRHTCDLAGFPDVPHPRGELHPSELERAACRLFRKKMDGVFTILWALSGSSMHKAYPYFEGVALALLHAYQDMAIVTLGDRMCRLLEFSHPRLLARSDRWDIRMSMLMTEHVDLVVGPETALLNAAGCFDTPKICFLTHSSRQNLTATWANDYSMQSGIGCSPCHKMIYTNHHDCPKMAEDIPFSACAADFPPERVIERIEEVYRAWKDCRGITAGLRPGRIVPGSVGDLAALDRTGRVAL